MGTNAFISEDEWNCISEENRQIIAEAISKDRIENKKVNSNMLQNTFYVK